MDGRINKYKYPGAKRLMLEAQELKDKTEDYCAQPIDDNLFEWHFTVRGPPETAFEGGFYHGRLSFPTEYPMKPPSIILLTPNGRFETNKKICLSISGYHPETWQPSWSVRTALLALIAFMPTKSHRAIGSLEFSDAERRKLARNSRTWRCETCGLIKDLLKHPDDTPSQVNASHSAGSSSVRDSSPSKSEQSDGKSLSSDSDGENRVSSSDPRGFSSTSITSGPDSDGSIVTTISDSEDRSQKNAIDDRNNCDTTMVDQPEIGNSVTAGPSSLIISERNLDHGPRRSNPSLVFISISVLLFLLILRRVVMIVQA